MIQRLSSANHKKVIEYLYREKEVNIFLISDIERYGYDSYFFSIYGVMKVIVRKFVVNLKF